LADDFDMQELFDDIPIAGEDDPDVTLGSQCPGQGRRHGRKAAHPDEVVHFSSDKQNSQKTSS
jgi:hypothetical protein